jgi:transposase
MRMEEIRCEMKPYSQDLRERVVKAVDEGLSRREIAKLFGVSEATIKRYLKLRRETANLVPKPIPGYPPRKIGALQKGLQPQLEAHPDATLEEHCKLWEAQTGVHVSISTMSHALQRLGWTRKKKTLGASERKEEEREEWRKKAKNLDVNKCRVIDETGSNIALTRLYARAPKGKRARGSIPRNRGKNVTLIADLSVTGLGELFLIDGTANGDLFEAYVEQILVPTLHPGETVIMDNLSIHKRKKVRDLIEAQRCQLLFLPAYSPDFSPIEEAFSKIKSVLRSIGARTREALQDALEYACATVTASDAVGWFRHCGYSVPDTSPQAIA